MEQPDYTPRRVHKINDPEEKKLAFIEENRKKAARRRVSR